MIKLQNPNNFYFHLILKKFNTKILKKGKRNPGDQILLSFIKQIKSDKDLDNRNVMELFNIVLQNVLIRFTIKMRKKGKVTQEIPVPIQNVESVYSNTIKLLIKHLISQKNSSFENLFLREFHDILKNQGLLKKKVNNLNKVIIKNRKYIN